MPAKRGKKDPNAPKKPLSGYFIFSNEKRAEVKAANPDSSIGEIAKKMGEMWGELSDDEKKPYLDQAEKAKEQYKKDLAVYNENKEDDDDDEEEDDEPKKKKRAKDPNAPKKPLSAYFLFLGDKRAQVKEDNPDLNNKEIVKELGSMWTALGDDDKKVYNDKAAKEKVKYEKAMAEYNKSK